MYLEENVHVPFLLSAFVSGWISASVSQYQTVEAQHGEEVTLLCNNISKFDTQIFWSRLVNRTMISCIVVQMNYGSKVTVCDGYEKGKFEMKSNISTVFLNIKNVDSSDSGLYYCGFSIKGIPSLTPIHLKINGKITVFFSLVLSVQFALFCLYSAKEDQNREQREVNPIFILVFTAYCLIEPNRTTARPLLFGTTVACVFVYRYCI
uniref:Ig-like domain-containing protein n=1 Tax=Sparus aurata TaxID=8175 RepID=A0A671XV09_SPAAU